MPTPIDRAMQSRNFFLGFAGLVALASAWNMFSGDIFPAETRDPDGAPETWSDDELRQWLRKVSIHYDKLKTIELTSTSEILTILVRSSAVQSCSRR